MTADNSITITRRFDDSGEGAALVRVPRLIVAFECRRPLCPGLRLSLADVDEVRVGRGTARQWSRVGRQIAIAIPDVEMSRLHIRLERTGEGWTLHDLGSKNGTLVGGVRATRRALADRDLIEIGGSLLV
ncbi:MAG TPA: FHA domain-containing protein, partial [Kofleriaceae bacterium]|nr:FHA domain-containing protein [Kofleriaceae bacterium]